MHKMSTSPPLPKIYIQLLVSVGTDDAVKRYMYIGVSVDWKRRCKTCQSLRELDNQGTVFVVLFFLAVTMMVIELDHIVQRGEP